MNNLNAITNPNGGTVVLRGIPVDVNSDVGAAFVQDVCRHVEDLLPADALRAKYGLQSDEAYEALGSNEPLQRAIAAAKTRRVHDGSAAREKAQHAFLGAPSILNGIMSDTSASARHRIEAARELRACASVGPSDAQANEKERFVIRIDFGTAKTRVDVPMKAIKPELTIEAGHDEGDTYEPFERDF
jgi:hypothetical protein